MAQKKSQQAVIKEVNVMRKPKIEKLVLSVGGTADSLERGFKLLERISGRKPVKKRSHKRIPSLNVRPGLEVGAMVTIRGKDVPILIKRLLVAINNTLRKKQFSENSFSFGIKEYIEIPGITYQRDIGIRGLDVTITFTRAGRRVKLKKAKSGQIPKKQNVSKEEIIKYMEENFGAKIK